MRRLASAFLIMVCSAGSAIADPALKLMRGTWRGEGRVVVIDTERMLANIDAEKPFQRDALVLRNISGRMIVFDVGTRRFIGLFDGTELRLTGDAIEGSAILKREPPSSGRRRGGHD